MPCMPRCENVDALWVAATGRIQKADTKLLRNLRKTFPDRVVDCILASCGILLGGKKASSPWEGAVKKRGYGLVFRLNDLSVKRPADDLVAVSFRRDPDWIRADPTGVKRPLVLGDGAGFLSALGDRDSCVTIAVGWRTFLSGMAFQDGVVVGLLEPRGAEPLAGLLAGFYSSGAASARMQFICRDSRDRDALAPIEKILSAYRQSLRLDTRSNWYRTARRKLPPELRVSILRRARGPAVTWLRSMSLRRPVPVKVFPTGL